MNFIALKIPAGEAGLQKLRVNRVNSEHLLARLGNPSTGKGTVFDAIARLA